jgi:hypothetical protein
MTFAESRGPDLLPTRLPTPALIPALMRADLAAMPSQDRLILSWTTALATVFEAERRWTQIPGYRFAAYGFIDPSTALDAFGVIVYARAMVEASDRAPELSVDGVQFPVIIRRSQLRLHGAHSNTIHPKNGTAACWAVSGKPTTALPNGRKTGLLVAKHVIENQVIGSPCPSSDPSEDSTLLDLGPDGIDAALIEAPPSYRMDPTDPKNGMSSVNATKYIIPWTDVYFEGNSSGRLDTKVTAVTDTRGVLNSSLLPSRVFLADAGLGGDSGSLILDSSGNGIATYIGELSTPAGYTEGLSQHLWQTCELMNLKLYKC